MSPFFLNPTRFPRIVGLADRYYIGPWLKVKAAMTRFGKLKILYRLLNSRIAGMTHAARVENFYREQADDYDESRARMLRGREELLESIPIPDEAVMVELGAGTGFNLELLGDRVSHMRQAHLVDLSPSLLKIARRRIEKLGFANVHLHEADATVFSLPQPVDVVICSYSLTMIPDWFVAIDNARRLLKPDGVLAVVDYYVSRNFPTIGQVRHGWSLRTYAPTLFERNGVRPNPDHIYYLHYRFDPIHFSEHMGKAYGRYLNVPYFRFIGRPKKTNWDLPLLPGT